MNKQRERATVEAFLRSMSFSNSSVHEWDRERPDVLVQIGDELVGIEITTITEATPRQTTAPQKWAAEAVRVVRAARESFEHRNPAALVVRFELRPAWQPPGRSNMAKLADALALIADEAIANPPPFIRPGEPVILRDPHPDISWAYVARTRQELGGHWAPSFAQNVIRSSAADITATVARKEPEVDIYRRVAGSVWLLIDCDLTGQGISLDVPQPNFEVNSQFDRVFCCGFGRWQWVEIPVAKAMVKAAG